ncbi:sensor histidine kinase [Actinoplanes flavus]|uniref:histidine kinase n=1 Tax=Actinoplanes flavus TaxID=2820290 RepID=A0ABS3V0M7_9ACTN|nr:ATP-binding protein [Actinoplanes flavus]MBO3744383.1 GAF domain-containing protein [Actinoplanes flavus]
MEEKGLPSDAQQPPGDADAPMVHGTTVRQVDFITGTLTEAPISKFAAVTARAAGAPTAVIHLAEGDQLRLAGGSGLPDGWQAISRVPATSTLTGLVIGQAHPLIIADIDKDPRVPRHSPARAVGARAFAGFPIRDPHGEIVGVCAVLDYQPRQWSPAELAGVDEGAQACTAFVVEHRAREDAEQQRLFLDAMLDSMQTGVAACDADGRLVFTNHTMRRLSGPTPADGSMQSWARNSPLTDADGNPIAADDIPLLRALAGERLRDLEVTVHLPDQRAMIVTTDAQPITTADGRRLGAVIAAHDITDRRRAERMRATELAVSEALAHAPSVRQAGPRILQAVCTTLGWPYAELWLVDEQADTLIPAVQYTLGGDPHGGVPPQLQHGDALTGAAWRTGKPVWIGDLDIPAATAGSHRRLHTGLAIPVPSGGHVLAVLSFFAGVVEDVTDDLLALLSGIGAHVGEFLERRRAEELTLALARSKDEYLALIGHELRTPLTSIGSYIEVMRDSDPSELTDELPAIVDVLSRNSDIMRHIIDDLLDLSALDSGHAELARVPVDLVSLVTAAVIAARPAAEAAGISLHLTAAPSEANVSGDPDRLGQVVTHLIDNAVNHSLDGGRITVTVIRPAPTTVQLDVTDTGIGVPTDEQDYLFTRFYRSRHTRQQRIPGAGLGLAISRAIIERHHGSIRHIPSEQAGTRISVRLPTGQPGALD